MKYEILGHFVKTLSADDKHSFCNCEILPQPIQMQLSKIHTTFSEVFCSISEIYINS